MRKKNIESNRIIRVNFFITGIIITLTLISCETKIIPAKYGVITTHYLDLNKNTTSQYDFAIKNLGAKKVRIKTPYVDKELYGVLLFNKAMDKCKAPVTRSYQLTIPEEYVQQAKWTGICII